MFHCVCVCAKSLQLCLTLCDPMDCTPPGSSVHGDSPGKNTGVDCHALLQGDLPDLGILPESLVFHCVQFSSVTQSCPTLRSHGLQLPCPSPSPQVCSNSCPSSQRWHPTLSHPLSLLWLWGYKYLLETLLSVLLDIHLDVELLNHLVILCLISEELPALFPYWLCRFTFLPTAHEGARFSVSSTTFVIFW